MKLGQGLGTSYPSAIDTALTEVDSPAAGKTKMRAAPVNDQMQAIISIETTLGTDPAGTLTNVKTFLQTEHTAAGAHLKLWKRVETKEITVATQSVTFSSLDGNADVMYMIIARIVGGVAASVYLRPNNDAGTNYGYQYIEGADTVIAASRNTAQQGLFIGNIAATQISTFKALLYAKSGYVRTLNGEASTGITGTTIFSVLKIDSVWSNTADNITSLVGYADVASGIGAGSFLELWKMLPST